MMKIYFIRHGESEANTLRIFSNRDVKHDLTEKGRGQAAELVEKLKDIPFAKCYTSPIYRAVRTSEILAEKLNLPEFIQTEGLREFDVGIFEGRTDDESWYEHMQLWDDWLIRGLYDKRHPEGENHYDIRERFFGWLDPLAAEMGMQDVNILAVTHGALLMTIMPFVLKNISMEFTSSHLLSNTAIVLAEYTENGFYCRKWDNTDF